MAFSLQDKLALMMTSAGSHRKLAAFIGAGVSHQKIGNWLTIGQTTPQGDPSRVRPPKDPEVLAAIDAAFEVHKDVAKAQARVERIPYLRSAPVYATRRVYSDGNIGQMIDVQSTHRLSNKLRALVITAAHETKPGFFHSATVQSTVARVPYWWRTEQRIKLERAKREGPQYHMRDNLAPSDEEDVNYSNGRVKLQRINTKSTPMPEGFPASFIIEDIESKLTVRHTPAIGDPGTALATKMSFQTVGAADTYGAKHEDTRRDERYRKASARRKAKERAEIKARG